MITAFRELHLIHKVFDEAAAALQRQIGVPLCVQCGRCCKTNTPTWLTIEALNAVSVLAFSKEMQEATSIVEGWLLDREDYTVYEGIPYGFMSARLREEWEKVSRRPCPLLTRERNCLIYQVRPLACRAYGVTRVADTCARPSGKGETMTQHLWIDAPALRRGVDEFIKSTKERNPAWVTKGQVPTLLYRAAKHDKFRQLVKDNKIASAKLVGTECDTSILWQPQVEMLRQGISPDLVAAAR